MAWANPESKVAAATSAMTIYRLRDEAPRALNLLRLLVFLAPEDVPRSMLLDGATALPGGTPNPCIDSLSLVEATAPLVRYGLIEVPSTSLAMHRTRQAVVRDSMSTDEVMEWCTAACRLVTMSFPDAFTVANWPTLARIVPHAMSVLEHLRGLRGDSAVEVELDARLSRYLISRGNFSAAQERLERAQLSIQLAEPNGRLHGVVLNLLSEVEREMGRFTLAVRHAEEAARIHGADRFTPDAQRGANASQTQPEQTRKAAEGPLPADLDLADDLQNLGVIAARRGRFDEAAFYLDDAHQILLQFPDKGGVRLAAILSEWFGVEIERQNWESASSALASTIQVLREVEGPQSVDAELCGQLQDLITNDDGKLDEIARKYVDSALAAYGATHPGSASALRLLATVLSTLGQFSEAREHLEDARQIDLQIYGPAHYQLAVDEVELGLVAANLSDFVGAESHLGLALDVVMAALPEDRESVLRLSRIDAALAELALSPATRELITLPLKLLRERKLESDPIVDEIRLCVIAAIVRAGDALLATGATREGEEQYLQGLELARLTTETPYDDATMLLRLALLAAIDGDQPSAMSHCREALDLVAQANRPAAVWWILTECGAMCAVVGHSGALNGVLDGLVDEAKEQRMIANYKGQIMASVPDGWFVKESITLLAADGQANVIASSEPLDGSIDVDQYAEVQGQLLRTEFPGYEEKQFSQVELFGGATGYRRHFEWIPPDGSRVTQIQLYYVELSRGYTATATTPSVHFEQIEEVLRQALRGLRIVQASDSVTASAGLDDSAS